MFVSFYARRLLLIALASIPVYVTYRVVKNIIAITILRWLFSISLVLWTTFFLENWKRRNAYINIEWGLNDYKEDMADNTRAQYEGELRYGFYCEGGFVPLCDLSEANSNARTDGMLQHASIRVPEKEEELLLPQNAYSDPMQVRNMKLQSVAVTAFFVILVGSLTFLLLWFRNEVVAYFEPRTGKTFANAFPGILNGILITAFDSIWRIVSLTLTRRENHRTNQEFENSLIYKRFAFQFVSNCTFW